MAFPETSSDEPLTPAGRLFLQPHTNVVIHCILRGKNPADIDAIKSTIKTSLMVQHPRFCSLLVRDKNGFEHWRRTKIDVDRHVIVINNRLDKSDSFVDEPQGSTTEEDDEAAANQYVADLSVSCPLSMDKPLWELHVLMAHRCAVFRIHHALGDGISLMSMLMASCRRTDDSDALPRMVPDKRPEITGVKGRDWFWLFGVLWWFLKTVLYTWAFSVEFVLRSFLVSDERTVLAGGEGVELWPRKLATAKFLLDDMKVVKRAVPNTTINDVLLGVVSSGLSRYLDHRTPNALREGLRMTGVAMVNIRAQPGLQDLSELMKNKSEARWGNKFGVILLPEQSFTISNVVGPLEEISLAGNPLSSIKVSTSSLPQAITMHMLSYAGKAEMQILVAKDIIPDPEFLAKCFEDALLDMKEAAA
ncbi:hypothetical protein V6N13_089821 [Hibiscus sabdariffa]